SGGGRSDRRCGGRDGVHRPAPLPPLSDIVRLGGDPPSPYEDRFGFGRIVAVEGTVFIGGTTSVTPDGMVIVETPGEQTTEILRKIEHELGRAGATRADVVLTRC